jgi:hypothetical protein
METIVAAIIAGVLGLIGIVITAFVSNERNKKTEKKLIKLDEVTSQGSLSLYEAYKESCGYYTGSVTRTMKLIDVNGTVDMRTSYQNLRVLWNGMSIPGILGKAWVDHPKGKIATSTKLINKSAGFTKDVYIGDMQVKEDGRSCTFRYVVTGGLTITDPPLDYEDQTILAHGVCVTREEMEDAYKQDEFKNEYHSYDVIHPMDTLILKVEFPAGYKVQPFPIVFYINSEFVNNRELERVKDNFKQLSVGAEFKIDIPRLGFRYAIYWIPPTESEIAHLKH